MSTSGSQAIFSFKTSVGGFATFPLRGNRTATVKEAVHDGDTVSIQPAGNLSIRLLGVDTPEISFQFPKIEDPHAGKFSSTREFSTYLADPFSDKYPDSAKFKSSLGGGLEDHLAPLLGPDCAKNHYKCAIEAQRTLEELILEEFKERTEAGKPYRFFMAFAHEIMDGYGRFLCYLHRDNTKREQKENPFSYNERMLELGAAFPYFIWPNINPFKSKPSYIEAVPPPEKLRSWVDGDKRLSESRRFVREAREKRQGVFEGNLLAPFELRFLARRKAPNRSVLNLATCDRTLLKPTEYYLVENPEDRLYIDEHFIPLFLNEGYEV